MTGAEFCALSDAAKAAHVATLNRDQRRKLIDAVADHHKAKGEAADPFRLRLNQQFREWAAKRQPK